MGQRGAGPRPRHAELARLRRQDALRHHGDDEGVFALGIVDEDALYAAMDWLVERQEAIEKRLARRHLKAGGLVLFDLTSSYFEGVTCPPARIGYSRDGQRGTQQVNYGLLTDARGCPVSVSVFEGNVADTSTLLGQGEKVRQGFGLDRLVLVGDRGMISNVQIDALRQLSGVDAPIPAEFWLSVTPARPHARGV